MVKLAWVPGYDRAKPLIERVSELFRDDYDGTDSSDALAPAPEITSETASDSDYCTAATRIHFTPGSIDRPNSMNSGEETAATPATVAPDPAPKVPTPWQKAANR